jgi:hypothetical protein
MTTPFVFDLNSQPRTGKNLSVFGCSSCLQKAIVPVVFSRKWILSSFRSSPILPELPSRIAGSRKAAEEQPLTNYAQRSRRRSSKVIAESRFTLTTVLEIAFAAARS